MRTQNAQGSPLGFDKLDGFAHIPAPAGNSKESPMVSSAKLTKKRRHIRDMRKGRDARKARNARGTPSFPLQPEGYDPKAPDAKAS